MAKARIVFEEGLATGRSTGPEVELSFLPNRKDEIRIGNGKGYFVSKIVHEFVMPPFHGIFIYVKEKK